MNNKAELSQVVTDCFFEYGLYTIYHRALPDVRDGLKPIHRRILYAMHKDKIDYKKEVAKSTQAVSATLKYHPHGDSSVYEAISKLVDSNGYLTYPWIEGEGGFGNCYSQAPPSASRYTSCRLNNFADEMFLDLDKQGVIDFIGEGEHREPEALQSSYPVLLTKQNEGIGVGFSCNFPSFNLVDVCSMTIDYIKDNQIDMLEYVKAPDFTTGGYAIYNEVQMRNIINNGKGSITLRCKYEFDKAKNRIWITEIPFNTTIEVIEGKIKQLVKEGKIKDITDIKNLTGYDKATKKDKLRIAIDIKRNTNVEVLMAQLYKSTPLQTNLSVDMTCVCDGEIKTLGFKPILDEWIKFRQQCIFKSKMYDRNKKDEQLKLNMALEKVLLDLDKAIEIVKKSNNDKETISNLMSHFSIDEEQAEYVANIKLRNFNKDFILNKTRLSDSLREDIANIDKLLSDINLVNGIIIADLERVRKEYGKPRITEILFEDNVVQIAKEELVEDYNCNIVITKEYIKKNLRFSEIQKLKDDDKVLLNIPCNNRDKVLIFTNKNNMYMLKVDDVQQCQPSTLGQYLPNILEFESGEEILYSLVTDESYQGNLVFFYKDSGKVAKIPLQSYKANRRKLSGVYSKSEVPMYINFEKNDDEVIFYKLISSIDKCLIIKSNELSISNSRTANGIYSIRSKNDSYLDKVEKLSESDIIENPAVYTYYLGKTNSIGKFIRKEDKNSL